jgi:hypothetical protein
MYNVSVQWMRRRIYDGYLPAVKAGRRVLLFDRDLAKFFRGLKGAARHQQHD